MKSWTNLKPDNRALFVVILMGALGALLACWWKMTIGDKDLAASIEKLPVVLRMCLGGLGAAAAVFILAKTDTAKLIHCGIIAALFGMAGPYLIIKALGTLGVNPELVNVLGIHVVQATTAQLESVIQGGTTNPQKIVDALDQTAQATSGYLTALKSTSKDEKKRAIADNKTQLTQTLQTLKAAAAVAPKQSIPLINKLASEATDAGAPELAQEARNILENNPNVQAAEKNLIGKVYFITPPNVTDSVLNDLIARIRTRFALADIQPAVHPTRTIQPGLEVVYYRDSDQQIASELSRIVSDYMRDSRIVAGSPSVRKGSSDLSPAPFQFDIHIGPDLAGQLSQTPPSR